MLKKKLSIAVVVLFLSISVIQNVIGDSSSFGNTIYVDDDGGADFTRIQDAINYSKDGDEIIVKDGIYHENIVITKSIILIGDNCNNTIIDGGEKGDVVTINSDNVFLSGFNIRNSTDSYYNASIILNSKYCTITNNNLNNNSEGIWIYGSNNVINGNILTKNSRDGIILTDVEYINITNNIIKAGGDDGIRLKSSKKNTIFKNDVIGNFKIECGNNKVIDNSINGYVLITGSNNTVSYNNITCKSQFGGCIILEGRSVDNTIIIGNMLEFKKCKGIEISSSNSNTIVNNKFTSIDATWGIDISNSNDNIVADNVFLDSSITIKPGVNRITIINNTFQNGGLDFSSSYLDYTLQNTIENNMVNNKPLLYLEGESDIDIVEVGQIFLINCNNIRVKNQIFSNTSSGIELFNSHNCQFSSNIFDNIYKKSILLDESDNNLIRENIFSNQNDYCLYMYESHHNTIIDNDMSGKITTGACNYNYIIDNVIVLKRPYYNPFDIGGVGNHIEENVISKGNIGLAVYGSFHVIRDNTIFNTKYGIYVESSGNDINNNNITSSDYGIYIELGTNNNFNDNDISFNEYGVYVESGTNNDINDNDISFNEYGVYVESDNVAIHNNNFIDNKYGVFLDTSKNNNIVENNFINNSHQAKFQGYIRFPYFLSLTTFDLSYPNNWNKNYWSDYSGYIYKIKGINTVQLLFSTDYGFGEIDILNILNNQYDRNSAQEPYDIPMGMGI